MFIPSVCELSLMLLMFLIANSSPGLCMYQRVDVFVCHPELTMCSRQDVKVQVLTCIVVYLLYSTPWL